MYFHSGQSVLHSDHSVPNSWDVIKNWLDPSVPEVNIPPPPEPSFSIKCPEIDELPYYDRTPPLLIFGITYLKIMKNHYLLQKLILMNSVISFLIAKTNGLPDKKSSLSAV